MTETENKIREFADLKHNWDSCGGLLINQEVIDAACAFARSFGDTQLYAFPCADGNIQIEFEIDGYEFEIEIAPQNDNYGDNITGLWEKTND